MNECIVVNGYSKDAIEHIVREIVRCVENPELLIKKRKTVLNSRSNIYVIEFGLRYYPVQLLIELGKISQKDVKIGGYKIKHPRPEDVDRCRKEFGLYNYKYFRTHRVFKVYAEYDFHRQMTGGGASSLVTPFLTPCGRYGPNYFLMHGNESLIDFLAEVNKFLGLHRIQKFRTRKLIETIEEKYGECVMSIDDVLGEEN